MQTRRETSRRLRSSTRSSLRVADGIPERRLLTSEGRDDEMTVSRGGEEEGGKGRAHNLRLVTRLYAFATLRSLPCYGKHSTRAFSFLELGTCVSASPLVSSKGGKPNSPARPRRPLQKSSFLSLSRSSSNHHLVFAAPCLLPLDPTTFELFPPLGNDAPRSMLSLKRESSSTSIFTRTSSRRSLSSLERSSL